VGAHLLPLTEQNTYRDINGDICETSKSDKVCRDRQGSCLSTSWQQLRKTHRSSKVYSHFVSVLVSVLPHARSLKSRLLQNCTLTSVQINTNLQTNIVHMLYRLHSARYTLFIATANTSYSTSPVEHALVRRSMRNANLNSLMIILNATIQAAIHNLQSIVSPLSTVLDDTVRVPTNNTANKNAPRTCYSTFTPC